MKVFFHIFPVPTQVHSSLLMLSEQSSTFITMDEPVLPLLDVLLIFYCCDKTPRPRQLLREREGELLLGLQFQRMSVCEEG